MFIFYLYSDLFVIFVTEDTRKLSNADCVALYCDSFDSNKTRKQRHVSKLIPYSCRKSSPAGSSEHTESLHRAASCSCRRTVSLRVRAQHVGRVLSVGHSPFFYHIRIYKGEHG